MVPSLTVIALFGGIPSVDSGVVAVSGTVPVPVASAPADVEEPDELEELEDAEDDDSVELAEEDEVELPDCTCCSSLWIAAVSALLVRVNASWLDILARPLDKEVIAELIAEITASLFAAD